MGVIFNIIDTIVAILLGLKPAPVRVKNDSRRR
jgi:hypothetical protein